MLHQRHPERPVGVDRLPRELSPVREASFEQRQPRPAEDHPTQQVRTKVGLFLPNSPTFIVSPGLTAPLAVRLPTARIRWFDVRLAGCR